MMTDYCSSQRMDSEPNKMMGYLEKKIKMLGWKRYWFVLDGRLLTYYKSQSEYESLSACCGSINLGIAINVSPIQSTNTRGFPLQIVTRTQVYFLRAGEKSELNHWLIAIQEGVEIPPKISTVPIPLTVASTRASTRTLHQHHTNDPNNSKLNPDYASTLTQDLDADTDSSRLQLLYPFRSSLSTLSLSQWSVNTSVEDLSNWTIPGSSSASLNNPRQKNILKKYCSLASLHFKSDNRSFSHYNNNNYYSTPKSKSKSRIDPYVDSNINNPSNWKIDEMQEIIPRNKTNFTKARNTSSMLVLGSGSGSSSSTSSPQQTSYGHSHSHIHSHSHSGRKSTLSFPVLPVTNPVERLVTWDNTSKSRTATATATSNMKKHSHSNSDTVIDNIYTNTSDEFSRQGQGQGQSEIQSQASSSSPAKTLPSVGSLTIPNSSVPVHHDYDEIADLKARNPNLNGIQNPKNPSEGVYENIDSESRNDDPWEKLPTTSTTLASSVAVAGNRKSVPLRNSLGAIEEIPENSKQQKHSSSQSQKIGAIADDPLVSSPGTLPRNNDPDDTRSNTLKKNDNRSGASSSEDKNTLKKRKKNASSKKSFSGFFHKIFNKTDKKKQQQQPHGAEEDSEDKGMIITGPVDLRKHQREQKLNAALSSRQTYTFTPDMGIPYTQSLAVSQSSSERSGIEVDNQNQQFNTTSKISVMMPAIGSKSDISSNEDLVEELNKKMGEKKRQSGSGRYDSDLPSHERISFSQGQGRNGQDQNQRVESDQRQSQGQGLNNSTESDSPPQILRKKSGNDIPSYKLKVNQHMSMTHTPTHRPSIEIPVRAVSVSTGDSEEFLRKLAHFNRLSASLDPHFVAAVSKLRTSFTNSNNFGLSRSNSLKIQSSVLEEPPVLPPKRRQTPQKSLYDTPMNNTPVITQSDTEAEVFENTVPNQFSRLRELTKKYSAPDISFNNNNPNELRLFCPYHGQNKDSLLVRKSFDIQLQPSYKSNYNTTQENELKVEASPMKSSPASSSVSFIPPPRPPKSERNSAPPENCMVLIPSTKVSNIFTNNTEVGNNSSVDQNITNQIQAGEVVRSVLVPSIKLNDSTEETIIETRSATPSEFTTSTSTDNKEMVNEDKILPMVSLSCELDNEKVIETEPEGEVNYNNPANTGNKTNDIDIDEDGDETNIVAKVYVIEDKYYVIPTEPTTTTTDQNQLTDDESEELAEETEAEVSSMLTLSMVTEMPQIKVPSPTLLEEKIAEIIEDESDQIQTTFDLEDMPIVKTFEGDINEVIQQSRTNEIKIIQPPVPVRHHAEVLIIDLPPMQNLTPQSQSLNPNSQITTSTPTPIPTPTPSPSWSQKSVDIDSLEVLSNISSSSATTSNFNSNRNRSPQLIPASPSESPVPDPAPSNTIQMEDIQIPVEDQTKEVSNQRCNLYVQEQEGQGNEITPPYPPQSESEHIVTEKCVFAEGISVETDKSKGIDGNKKMETDNSITTDDIKQDCNVNESKSMDKISTNETESADQMEFDKATVNSENSEKKPDVTPTPTEINKDEEKIESSQINTPVPLKVNYATVNAVAWETVEETEEELNELYDEFPADINFTFPATATPVVSELDMVHMDNNDIKDNSVHQSGFEELQAFLFNEENQEGADQSNSDSEAHMMASSSSSSRCSSSISSHLSSSIGSVNSASSRGAAVNRLGHSSAIEQLKKMFDGEN